MAEVTPEKTSLTPCHCGYYTTSLIDFLYFLQSIASVLHSCRAHKLDALAVANAIDIQTMLLHMLSCECYLLIS